MSKNLLIKLYHILGSLAFLSIPILFSPDFSSDLNFIHIIPFQKDLIYHCLLLLFFYLNYLVLIPKFYFKNEYIIYTLCVVILLVCINFIPELIVKFISNENHFGPREHFPMDDMPHEDFMQHRPGPRRPPVFMFLKNLFQFILVAMVGLVIQINKRLKITEKNRLSTELSYLKSQINPHFLFNTLNSIYSLAIIGSEHTANAVVKLSNMMRYVLNDASRDYVSLEQEIEYISNYIELQKLRFGNAIKISFDVSGDFEGKMIAPLLIIPFIENAFKYGVNAEQNSNIELSIDIKQNLLHVLVKNKKVDYTQTSMDSHGIGIENTKSRLVILYPNKHILSIESKEDSYEVSLILHFV